MACLICAPGRCVRLCVLPACIVTLLFAALLQDLRFLVCGEDDVNVDELREHSEPSNELSKSAL